MPQKITVQCQHLINGIQCRNRTSDPVGLCPHHVGASRTSKLRNLNDGTNKHVVMTAIPKVGFTGVYNPDDFKKGAKKLSNDELVAKLQEEKRKSERPSFGTRLQRFKMTRNFGEFSKMF